MSKTNYKRLGDYIREVDVRNRDLEVKELLGVSVSKEFIPSIANTIGTDMSSYKIVKIRQFVYIEDTSRRGDKIAIALLQDMKEAIVSSIYKVFEVKKQQELLPEYLMMWFRRPEFDRYARFKSHGSAREIFSWEEMCDVELPIPPIDQQQKIVAEYNAIQQRIKLNEQLIVKLEETAQAIYRKMFVDGIDKNNLPEGWRMGTLGEFIQSASKTHSLNKSSLIFLNTSDIYKGRVLHHKYSKIETLPGQAKKEIRNGDILFSEIRPENKRFALVKEYHPEDFIVSTKLMVLRMKRCEISNIRIYFYLTQPNMLKNLQRQAEGASGTFPQITFDGNLANLEIIIGDINTEKKWNKFLLVFYNNKWNLELEIKKLIELQSLILSKMGL